MQTQKTIEVPPLCVRADIVGGINDTERTLDVVFSTGAAVLRTDYWSGKQYREVLSMEPAHVRLDRLNAAGPVLDTHSAWSVTQMLGAVEPGSARVEKGKGIATIRFSKRDEVTPIWQDIKDKIIRALSTGYATYKAIEEQPKDGAIATRTATDWEPYEISMVPMPADLGAKVRAGDKSTLHTCVILSRTLTDDADRLRRFRLATYTR